MSEASDPRKTGGGPGPDRTAAFPEAAAPAEDTRHGRFHWPHLGRTGRTSTGGGPASGGTPEPATGGTRPAATAGAHEARHVPTGLGASLATSGGVLLAMVEDVRMREANRPEDLRPLADAFARHNAAKEATVRKVLLRHGAPENVVERDRQEGDLIQGILDRALVGGHPADTHVLTVDGALAQAYQYLFHERRDLVSAIERWVPADESETLSAAFEAIAAN
ncbi:hypothetical protein [Actinacidiphila acidipaludis]|uniref:Uncharacterized protein n=1 Tax=Actinacidiphila acidipaludis TaxID=2873382 RepID=A0ABS7Q8X6_9ACTN|nr:hypothetical protein [Streptomyces acidipaludis]MBY8879423.1 hypothetical protein [Streptomyces acidipaludis]